MDVANSAADIIDNLISLESISQDVDEKRNRDTLQEFEQDAARIAKFDPEDEIPSMDELYDQLTDNDGDLEYDAVQIGGTFGVESDGFMDWVEAADELSNMGAERGSHGLSVLAEPSEQSHVLSQKEPKKAVLDPDYFTVPRITNTEKEKYRYELHEEFIDEMDNRIEDGNSKKALSKRVSDHLINHLSEKLPDNNVARPVGDIILSASGGVADAVAEKKVESYLQQQLKGTGRSEDADSVIQDILWSQWVTEDYFVTNPKASVATKTGADDWLQGKSTTDLMQDVQEKIKQSAEAKNPRYRAQSVFYIEGSGAQTPFEIIQAADLARQEHNLDTQIVYGGGIENGHNQPDLIRHNNFELEYGISDDELSDAGFDPDQFEAVDYDPEELDGREQKELVGKAGADAYIQGNSVQI